MMASRAAHGRKRAVILIMVLWIAVLLGLLAYSVVYQTTLEVRLTSARKKALQAESLARAGLARAFVDLRNDLIFDQAVDEEGEPPFDAEGDVWALNGIDDKTDVRLGDGTFSVEVLDEERLFNLNRMSRNSLPLLQKIIESIGYNEEDAKMTAAAIVDYADRDDQSSLESASGNEGFAYGTILAEINGGSRRESEIEPVRFPDEPYLTVDALQDVFGVTPELYFGPGSPEAEYYREIQGPLPGRRFQINDRRRSKRDGPPLGLRDYFTVEGSRRLNVNTAPQHVLAALLEGAGRPDGERLAESIVDKRRGGSRRNVDNKNAFKKLDDFSAVSGLADVVSAANAMHQLDVKSSVFRVIATGVQADASVTLEVLVSRRMATMQVDESFEAIDRAEDRRDRLSDKRRRRRDRDDENVVRVPNVRIIGWARH